MPRQQTGNFTRMMKTLLTDLLSLHFTLSKRLLGLLLLIGGVVGFFGILAIDLIDIGREGGIGPAQQIALGGCVGLALLGLSLLPLGDTAA